MPIVARKPKIVSASCAASEAEVAPSATSKPVEDRYAHIVPRVRVRRPIQSEMRPSNDPDLDLRAVTVPEPVPASTHAGATYEVGYAKPPKATQFKKGVSGNPKGRPKGAKGLNTLVLKVFGEKVAVRTGSGTLRMSKMEAMIHKLAEQGFGGNLRAISIALNRYAASVPDDAARPLDAANDPGDLDEHDRAILEALRDNLRDGES
jgi:hypothetical protein